MNKTHQELCDENLQLREQLAAERASTNLARLATRQAVAKAEALERERDRAASAARNDLIEWFGRQYPHLAQPVCGLLAHRAKTQAGNAELLEEQGASA